MQFTKNEIELAGQLKEAGLEWEPEVGDWFLSNFNNAYVIPNQTAVLNFNKQVGGTWLPLWHQCRIILKRYGIELTVSDVLTGIKVSITLWKRLPCGGIEFYHQIVADTDLEAMYQAVLSVMPARRTSE